MIHEYDPRAAAWNDPPDRAPRSSGAVSGLAVVAVLLALVIVAGTVIAYASGSRQRKLASEAAAAQAQPTDGQATFTGIGTLRAATIDSKPAIVIATIAFPYKSSDRAFKEELIRKAPALKEAAVQWFSRRKASELASAYEGGIKAALRDTFNSLLSLGKVNQIWLSDFSVVQ
jgi:flagellar basal body-associated protein FliL